MCNKKTHPGVLIVKIVIEIVFYIYKYLFHSFIFKFNEKNFFIPNAPTVKPYIYGFQIHESGSQKKTNNIDISYWIGETLC